MPQGKVKREDLKPGEVLCEYCTAKCCRYFALPIDTPDTREEFDYLRWYMIHGRVSLFVDEGTWYLMVHADCRHLLPDNRCGIYETRPQICRDYTTENCEYDDDATYDQFFETPEQLEEFAEAFLPQKRRPRSNRRVELPVLSGVVSG
jgi:Fe-S-cluster containining protein